MRSGWLLLLWLLSSQERRQTVAEQSYGVIAPDIKKCPRAAVAGSNLLQGAKHIISNGVIQSAILVPQRLVSTPCAAFHLHRFTHAFDGYIYIATGKCCHSSQKSA